MTVNQETQPLVSVRVRSSASAATETKSGTVATQPKLQLLDFVWLAIFVLALSDVVISYFGRNLGIGPMMRPWMYLAPLTALLSLVSISDLRQVRWWLLLAFTVLISSFALGMFIIEMPSFGDRPGFAVVRWVDLVAMSGAFLIGMFAAVRFSSRTQVFSDVLLAVAAFHALVCVLAVIQFAPHLFPVIDSPYYKDGQIVSRPEITTDQTRQVLYLFLSLCGVFIRRSLLRLMVILAVGLAIAFVVVKVQSRWSAVIYAIFFFVAMFMGMHYKKQPWWVMIGVAIAGVVVTSMNMGLVLEFAADLIFRFSAIDASLGGRALAVLHLFEKLPDPNYWVPHGYLEFHNLYGVAPHSFPTMIYLMGGLLALLAFVVLMLYPLCVMGIRVLGRRAGEMERIGFFAGAFAFALLMTQPVITHEIFWLIAGLVAGAVSSAQSAQPSDSVSK